MNYQAYLKKEAMVTFNLAPVIWFATIFPIIIGMLLRLPKLIIQMIERKSWTFDWVTVISIGIPALYIALLQYFPYSSLGMYMPFARNFIIIDNYVLTMTGGIVFGYVLLASIKK
jgi:energy-converting hydrogenase Eha subunit A